MVTIPIPHPYPHIDCRCRFKSKHLCAQRCFSCCFHTVILFQLVVSTHLKNISQNGNRGEILKKMKPAFTCGNYTDTPSLPTHWLQVSIQKQASKAHLKRRNHSISFKVLHLLYPTGSMRRVYLPTFTINMKRSCLQPLEGHAWPSWL